MKTLITAQPALGITIVSFTTGFFPLLVYAKVPSSNLSPTYRTQKWYPCKWKTCDILPGAKLKENEDTMKISSLAEYRKSINYSRRCHTNANQQFYPSEVVSYVGKSRLLNF